MRSATTETVQKALRERIIARFGMPMVLMTDNGTQFPSKKFTNFLNDLGIQHQRTAPYTPQENPTERVNRTIKTMLAQFAKGQHNKWDEFLPEFSLAINTNISESTAYSHALLNQGREPRLPKQLYDEYAEQNIERQFAKIRAQRLQEIFNLVLQNQTKASDEQARHYNLRHRDWMPYEGDQVLLKANPLPKAEENFAAKPAPKFEGPYKVKKISSPVLVTLEKDGKTRTAHVNQLKTLAGQEE